MNVLERIISVFAPHECIGCGKEGTLLCELCRMDSEGTIPSRCYRCHMVTLQFQVCPTCYKKVGIKHVWVSGDYSNQNKQLIHKMKFERAKSATLLIGQILDEFLPILPSDTIVTYIPTIPSRIRLRGYDQSKLIAKEFARRRGLLFQSNLRRLDSGRQVGSTRKTRFEQMENAFQIIASNKIKQSKILLIDDVLTTGATIESASKVLHNAGAKTVDVAVFAH